MKQLALMRHAKSSWNPPTLEDFDRTLNARGREAAPRMGQWLAEVQSFRPEIVLVSAAQRTRETWDLIAPIICIDATQVLFLQDLYLASEQRLLSAANDAFASADRVMVLAHNPGVEMLLWQLTLKRDGDAARAAQSQHDAVFTGMLPTAAIALIDGELKQGNFIPTAWRAYATPKAIA